MTVAFASVAALAAAGVPSSEVEAFFARAEQEAERARTDQALLGCYVLRDGRRVPPREWPPMRLDLELRPYLDAWLWPDPLSFIGAAANEGRS